MFASITCKLSYKDHLLRWQSAEFTTFIDRRYPIESENLRLSKRFNRIEKGVKKKHVQPN